MNIEEIVRTTLQARGLWMRERDIKRACEDACSFTDVDGVISSLMTSIERDSKPRYRLAH